MVVTSTKQKFENLLSLQNENKIYFDEVSPHWVQLTNDYSVLLESFQNQLISFQMMPLHTDKHAFVEKAVELVRNRPQQTI
jgi:hypothetical protein